MHRVFMHRESGILLTEVLVYLLIFSFFSVFILTFIARSSLSLMAVNAKNDQIVTITSAVDWVMRDIQSLDLASSTIGVEKDEILTLHNDAEIIVWKLKEKKLLRKIQRYDARERRWKKPYTSLVANNIITLSFQIYVRDGQPQGVECKISGSVGEKKTFCIIQAMSLRNGVV